jgi:ribonucleoside-diphosphate reductase beta chain
LLYSKLINKLSQHKVHEIIKDAVRIECDFVKNALPVELIGMNSDAMNEYIKFCADHLVASLGYDNIYNISNPFDWMEMISMQGKTNFFEKRVAEYSKAGVGDKTNKNHIFSLEEDF